MWGTTMPGMPPPGYDASRKRKRDDESSEGAEDPFTIKTADTAITGFKSRSSDIFAGLATLEQKHSAIVKVQSETKTSSERESLQISDPKVDPTDPRPRHNRFRPPQRSRRPRFGSDHKRNPGKWTSYDLSDVSRDQLSERSNSAAAFQFLQERKKLKAGGEEEKPADLEEKVQFARPHSKAPRVKISECGPSASTSDECGPKGDKKFSGSTRVMSEYVVGQSQTKPKRKVASSTHTSSAANAVVNLDYLEDEEHDSDIILKKVTKKGSKEGKSAPETIKLTLPEEALDQKTESGDMPKAEVKFKKFSSKKGMRRRRASDEDDD